MREATNTATTSTRRRDLLGAAGFTALAGIAGAAIARPDARAAAPTAAPDADAPLLALCDRFMTLQIQLDAVDAGREDVPDEEFRRIVARQVDILDQAGALTATTLAGHRARAMMLERYYTRDGDGELEAEVSWHRICPLFRDLLGKAV